MGVRGARSGASSSTISFLGCDTGNGGAFRGTDGFPFFLGGMGRPGMQSYQGSGRAVVVVNGRIKRIHENRDISRTVAGRRNGQLIRVKRDRREAMKKERDENMKKLRRYRLRKCRDNEVFLAVMTMRKNIACYSYYLGHPYPTWREIFRALCQLAILCYWRATSSQLNEPVL